MAGHSHWAGIKHQKGIADQKRAKLFSKLLVAISVAAKTETNPDFNPRLRSAIEKAKAEKVPQDAIERAIKRVSESGEAVEEVLFEAYGPDGTPILMVGATDNVNRTVQVIKKILGDSDAKWAEPGSVKWAFEEVEGERNVWKPKFPQEIPSDQKEKLDTLVKELEDSGDINQVFTGTL